MKGGEHCMVCNDCKRSRPVLSPACCGRGDFIELGFVQRGEKDDEEIAPIFTFLTSSLNVELVYIILTSIHKFCSVSQDEYGNSVLEATDDIFAILMEDTTQRSSKLIIKEIEI